MLTRLRTAVYTTVDSAEQCDDFVVWGDGQAAAIRFPLLSDTSPTLPAKRD